MTLFNDVLFLFEFLINKSNIYIVDKNDKRKAKICTQYWSLITHRVDDGYMAHCFVMNKTVMEINGKNYNYQSISRIIKLWKIFLSTLEKI
jgi:hypothetical protein